MKKAKEEDVELHLRPRATDTVRLRIPEDTLASIRKVAKNRDMSHQALLKLYIGQGLRQDLAKSFADRVLERTEEVLTRHIPSKKEVSSIIREIQGAATG